VAILSLRSHPGAFGSSEYWDRMATIWGGGGPRTTISDGYDASGVWGARWPVWQAGLQLMLAHPVIGVGPVCSRSEKAIARGRREVVFSPQCVSFRWCRAGHSRLALFVFLLYRAVKELPSRPSASRDNGGSCHGGRG